MALARLPARVEREGPGFDGGLDRIALGVIRNFEQLERPLAGDPLVVESLALTPASITSPVR